MDDKQKSALRARMLEEIETLKAALPGLEAGTKPVAPDAAIGRLSRLDTMINQGVADQGIANAKQRILRLENALSRLDDDPDFGLCRDCGQPIPLARLLALPESLCCVECAE